ncbi:MAG: hypothetical protein HWN79_16445 [Candidatus Lokiarchaeota archaeon]|nr:hypothetical protein [Candidatus Lokiarchaeota archaeon]
MTLILETTVFITIGLNYENAIMSHLFNISIEALLSILGIVAYIKQRS